VSTTGKIEKTPRFRQQKLASLKNGGHGNSFLRDEYRTALQVLTLLARAAEARKELAVRAALGAGRGDLV
jgi:hypothetical protein